MYTSINEINEKLLTDLVKIPKTSSSEENISSLLIFRYLPSGYNYIFPFSRSHCHLWLLPFLLWFISSVLDGNCRCFGINMKIEGEFASCLFTYHTHFPIYSFPYFPFSFWLLSLLLSICISMDIPMATRVWLRSNIMHTHEKRIICAVAQFTGIWLYMREDYYKLYSKSKSDCT